MFQRLNNEPGTDEDVVGCPYTGNSQIAKDILLAPNDSTHPLHCLHHARGHDWHLK